MGTELHDPPSVSRFIRQQEGKMRSFAKIMTFLCTFLLSFYTSTTVARWWSIRTAGVGAIKQATVDLGMLLHSCVTKDEQILSAVRRYGRASLLLIFMWRRKQLPQLKEMMRKRDLLTEDECDQLLKWNYNLHETIWAWQTAIVNKLYEQGKIESDQLYRLLLDKCTSGRAAVQCAHTHLAVRVPLQYVHMLGALVKTHNLVVAVIMGILFGAAFKKGMFILCAQLFLRTCMLPLLFNALLLMNCNLADPFDGSETDFPADVYQQTLEEDSVGIVEALRNTPKWMDSIV